MEERRIAILQSPVYASRQHATSVEYDKTLSIPDCLVEEDGWIQLFDGLLSILDSAKQKRIRADENNTIVFSKCCHGGASYSTSHSEILQQIAEVGARIKVYWSDEDIGDSGWKSGYCTAVVQSYDDNLDTLTIVYPSEPKCTYTIELTPNFMNNKIKLIQPVI